MVVLGVPHRDPPWQGFGEHRGALRPELGECGERRASSFPYLCVLKEKYHKPQHPSGAG